MPYPIESATVESREGIDQRGGPPEGRQGPRHTAVWLLLLAGLAALAAGVLLFTDNEPPPVTEEEADYPVAYSEVENLEGLRPLDGATVDGVIYVYLDISREAADNAGISEVRFYLDDALHQTENDYPYYLEGGHVSRIMANPFDTRTLSDGEHTLVVEIDEADGTQTTPALTFTVANGEAPEPTPAPPTGEAAPDDGTVAPVPAGLPSHSGLTFSVEEVQVWRERAQSGPYKSAGDVGPNSPGDWDRIVANKDAFLADPDIGLWEGPDGSGCVEQDSSNEPPREGAALLRDAAFYHLITGDVQARQAVHDRLMEQARQPGVAFGDRERWCVEVFRDVNPGFIIGNWLTQHLFAYDYLGREAFTEEEQRELDAWFLNFAEIAHHDVNDSLESLFADRDAGDYRTDRDRDCDGEPYDGGDEVCKVARYYNNRNASLVRYTALVGVHQDNAELVEDAKQWVKEFLQFGVFPEGYTSDFARGSDDSPELGWLYGVHTAGHAITIADTLSRQGDHELYEYETTAGIHGSEVPDGGDPKSLHFLMRELSKYVTGEYDREIDDDPITPADHYPGEVMLAQANHYYRDPYLRQVYTRTLEGLPPYPEVPAPNGPNLVWQGDGGIYPGVLFMYGQMEDSAARN